MVFNSLGSNYNFSFAWQALVAKNKPEYSEKLQGFLADMYNGQVVLTYKGREAINLALQALRLPTGSKVAILGYTCYAVYAAVMAAGCKPIFIDASENDIHFSPETLSLLLAKQPDVKVVIIQNTLGFSCNALAIAAICKQHNVVLIEDLAHSVGAMYEGGVLAGTLGDFTVLSFSQDKMIDGISGGALVIRNEHYRQADSFNLAEVPGSQERVDRWYPLLTFGIRNLYDLGLGKLLHALLRYLGWLPMPTGNRTVVLPRRLPEWYAGLVLEKFKELQKDLEHRRKIAGVYAAALDSRFLLPHMQTKIVTASNLRFPIFVEKRVELIQYLKKAGIRVSDIWYDAVVAPQKNMPFVEYAGECPVGERLAQHMVNLPTHRGITVTQAKNICNVIHAWQKSQ